MNNLSVKEVGMEFYKELMKPLPVSNNPLFAEVYGDYAEKYNSLAEEIVSKGININKLTELVEATKLYEKLGCSEAYTLGVKDTIKLLKHKLGVNDTMKLLDCK